jgi:hypothetical protein
MSGALESAERAHAESVAAEAAAAAARATRPEEREAWILAHTTLGGQTMRAGQGGRNRGAGALVGAFLRELLGG